MAADIVNLRRARKARNRARGEEDAARNRALFGRTKAEKRIAHAAARLDERRHEAHRLEQSGTADDDGCGRDP